MNIRDLGDSQSAVPEQGAERAVFGSYSRYYNLLYQDKDYSGETEYLHRLVQTYRPGARSLLDLGCGTGRHDLLLSQKGYSVVGVDISEEMLKIANSQPVPDGFLPSAVAFHLGDIRSVRLDRQFDVVVSLFHVISYQTSNDDLLRAFKTAREHLAPGGVFIFDFWYGPAVLTDRPAVRIKRLEDDEIVVTRIAEPVMQPNANLVDVNYQMLIRDKRSGGVEELRESHLMRYLFQPEIEMLLDGVGLDLVAAEEYLTGRPLGFDTWGACMVAREFKGECKEFG